MVRLTPAIKLNLTLRVGPSQGGMHPLCSLFWAAPSPDRLTVEPVDQDNGKDLLTVSGQVPDQCNLVNLLEATRPLRPFGLAVELHKGLPAGTGLGAGSGDAACLWCWLARRGWAEPEHLLCGGSDARFFAHGEASALVEGSGDRISSLPDLPLWAAVALPPWRCATGQAYRALDRRGGLSLDGAREQACELFDRLRRGLKIGVLPNDFLALQPGNPEPWFNVFDGAGALAWGVSGSGSALFGLFDGKPDLPEEVGAFVVKGGFPSCGD